MWEDHWEAPPSLYEVVTRNQARGRSYYAIPTTSTVDTQAASTGPGTGTSVKDEFDEGEVPYDYRQQLRWT
eukprot:scaffold634226_cov24-Prasinocladus_malaysianus.AAC.1